MMLRMRAVDMVEDAGYTPVEALDADEAVAILESRSDIALMCTDIQMPGSMDGVGLAQWVRRERPWLKVILTSGAARTAKEAGDHCPILAKPYDHGELERHIRSLLAR